MWGILMLVVVDLKASNLGSISNMLNRIGTKHVVTSEIDTIKQASKILLPGVGSYDNAITNLEKLNLIDVLKAKALEDKIPFLGICLGMQIMTRGSEEGKLSGLGLIKADTLRFKLEDYPGLKIPHMGWNIVTPRYENSLLKAPFSEQRFYFAHSFFVQCDDESDILAQTNHGKDFTCAFKHQNIWGVQFHPEKSHKFGMNLFKNFSELEC